MFETINQTNAQQAAAQLAKDPLLAPVIAQAGLCDIQPHNDYYRALCDSIIGQQLSVKAAATIKQRFRDLFGGAVPEPPIILDTSVEQLRSCGLSNSKAIYIQDLAQHILDGSLNLDTLSQQTNEAIVKELTAVKGIGEWTAHMFLMFCMGRTDVLAVGDLGIRSAAKKLYGLDNLPTPQQLTEIAKSNNWHPYESIACWYLWYSLDNAPA
jgi:DNA-3-methyladenine glycosylase II